ANDFCRTCCGQHLGLWLLTLETDRCRTMVAVDFLHFITDVEGDLNARYVVAVLGIRILYSLLVGYKRCATVTKVIGVVLNRDITSHCWRDVYTDLATAKLLERYSLTIVC